MGVLAVTLTTASLVMGIAIWRNTETGLSEALRLSVALGLARTCVLTIPIAGTMAGMTSSLVGDPQTGVAVPFVGWSREVGDLRIAHFLATHAMHALPLLGLTTLDLPLRVRKTEVWAGTLLFIGATVGLILQALAGHPLWPVS